MFAHAQETFSAILFRVNSAAAERIPTLLHPLTLRLPTLFYAFTGNRISVDYFSIIFHLLKRKRFPTDNFNHWNQNYVRRGAKPSVK